MGGTQEAVSETSVILSRKAQLLGVTESLSHVLLFEWPVVSLLQ